jgi:MICOS complex subunit MIC19
VSGTHIRSRAIFRTNFEPRRQDVISCLRINDRKPLDCWKEVEIFKREVRKLEESYVSSVL